MFIHVNCPECSSEDISRLGDYYYCFSCSWDNLPKITTIPIDMIYKKYIISYFLTTKGTEVNIEGINQKLWWDKLMDTNN